MGRKTKNEIHKERAACVFNKAYGISNLLIKLH